MSTTYMENKLTNLLNCLINCQQRQNIVRGNYLGVPYVCYITFLGSWLTNFSRKLLIYNISCKSNENDKSIYGKK